MRLLHLPYLVIVIYLKQIDMNTSKQENLMSLSLPIGSIIYIMDL